MKRTLSILVVLFMATTVMATIRLVPQQYSTIQAGINAANPGDTVLVAAGVYVENLQMREGVSLFGSGMDKTIVDGGGLANVITSPYGVLNLVISDLTARNSEQSGSAPGCIGIHLNPNSSSGTKVVRRCHVYQCGHGIQIWNDFGGTATIEDNVINNNLYDGFSPYLGTAYLLNNTIVNNGRDGYTDWSGGGAVYIQNNIIANNARYGIFKHQNTPVSISYNDVWNNAQGAYMQGYSGPAQPFIPQPGTGEISANPLFIGTPYPLHDQYYITWANFPTPDSSKSLCIDAGNPDVQFNDPDGSRGDMGALFFDQTEQDVSISLNVVGVPRIPPQGGNFTYTINLLNMSYGWFYFNLWMMVTLPNGNLYGPVTGPATLNIPFAIPVSRTRRQFVPASAPPGTYTYWAFVGIYPNHVWDQANFGFVKLDGQEDGSVMAPEDWLSTETFGDLAQPELTETIQPTSATLYPCMPNPFNATTAISYKLQAASRVSLKVYDTAGRLVTNLVDGWREAGDQQVTFDGSGLVSGVYLCRLETAGLSTVQKLVLLK